MTSNGKSTNLSAALRMLAMLRLIPRQSKTDTATLEKGLAELGWKVSRRTIQRDLRQLEQVFPDLECDGNPDIPGWSWKTDAEVIDIPVIDTPMALALILARRFLKPLMPPRVLAYLQPYFATAERVLQQDSTEGHWAKRVAIVPRSLPLIPADIDATVFEALAQALMAPRPLVLQTRYRNRNGEVRDYQLHPLGLVFRDEVAYLVATVWNYDDPRHFALHRFESCQVTDRPARKPEGFDLQRYLQSGAFQYPAGDTATIDLVLRVHRDTVIHLRETPLSKDQTIEDLDDTWSRLRATVLDSQQLRWWLLAMGPNVVVEAPQALREEIAEALAQAAAGYASDSQ